MYLLVFQHTELSGDDLQNFLIDFYLLEGLLNILDLSWLHYTLINIILSPV